MVDWSIFWNNIFPGLVLILSSSLGAYFLVHRYQRNKYRKEIRENLIQQEHKLLEKFYRWNDVLFNLITPEIPLIKEIDEKFSKLLDSEIFKKIDRGKLKKEDFKKAEDLINLKELELQYIGKEIEEYKQNIIYFDKLVGEIALDTQLLQKRLLLQLKKKTAGLVFITDFLFDFEKCSSEVLKCLSLRENAKNKKEIFKLQEELYSFFTEAEELILTSKIKIH